MRFIRNILILLSMGICLPLFAQGEGPPPNNLDLQGKTEWLIHEVGHSEDGYTVRESIQLTDEAIIKAVTDLRIEIETTDTYVFGILSIILIGLAVYVVRIRFKLSYLEGLIQAGHSDDN